MAAVTAHPVRALRELVTALEAAITLALANPKPKPVHHLRTTTRRIEAQLELLSLLPNLPEHAKPARKARKLLGKLRRAAGRVRDLDVQRKLTQSKSQEARHLRKLFKHQRDDEAKDLLDTIRRHQVKLIRALEDLLDALAAAESFALSESRLVPLILDWYAHNTPAAAKQNPRQLHNTRKAAKLARYIAESATPIPNPGTQRSLPKISHVARTFESLQKVGGDWHDWLTLSDIARREFGSTSPLTRSFTHHCKKSLAAYHRRLKSLPENIAKAWPPGA